MCLERRAPCSPADLFRNFQGWVLSIKKIDRKQTRVFYVTLVNLLHRSPPQILQQEHRDVCCISLRLLRTPTAAVMPAVFAIVATSAPKLDVLRVPRIAEGRDANDGASLRLNPYLGGRVCGNAADSSPEFRGPQVGSYHQSFR